MNYNAEIKQCQNCKQNFTIEPEDFVFYEKIKVPAPTFCPECRMMRRFLFRNERALYKRNCDLCNSSIISVYPVATPFPVYCTKCWWSDKWDDNKYYKNLDFSRPFFELIKELQLEVPRPHMNNADDASLINSVYTNCAGEMKNCYLVYGSMRDEDCYYSHYINDSKDCFDNLYAIKCENCVENSDIENSYGLLFSASCLNCRDSLFLFDCRNCSDCIACSGLRNKSYYVFNKPYSKEEYFKIKNDLLNGSYKNFLNLEKKFYKEVYYQSPRKYFHGQMNNNFSGDYIANTEKTYNSFYIKKARQCKNVFWCNNALDVYDYFAWGDVELIYEAVSMGSGSYNCKFTHTSWNSVKNLEYCDLCFSSSDLFGCVGLRKKQYRILNKQYTREEYEQLVPKIIEHMNNMSYIDKKDRIYKYGEFFPPELSVFFYNESVAQEHFTLTKDQALDQGYLWRDSDDRNIQPTNYSHQLADNIKEITDDILNQVIQCQHAKIRSDGSLEQGCNEQCTTAFKIIKPELEFYRKMNLPLPRLCPNCRHYQRIKQRNPLKLWKRKCMCRGNQQPTTDNLQQKYQNTATHQHGENPCSNEFQTTYSPECPEIVYCEQCYNAEVV